MCPYSVFSNTALDSSAQKQKAERMVKPPALLSVFVVYIIDIYYAG